jgi:predicted HicB family RNase H-like nuclease
MRSVGRPKQFTEERVTKALRIPESLDTRLRDAAAERGVAVNVLVNRAIEDYLDNLVPIEELLKARSA